MTLHSTPIPVRFCEHCKLRLTRKWRTSDRWESHYDISRRRFCNMACRAKAAITHVADRVCEFCGGVMRRREKSGYKESVPSFMKRRFCCWKCRDRARKAQLEKLRRMP